MFILQFQCHPVTVDILISKLFDQFDRIVHTHNNTTTISIDVRDIICMLRLLSFPVYKANVHIISFFHIYKDVDKMISVELAKKIITFTSVEDNEIVKLYEELDNSILREMQASDEFPSKINEKSILNCTSEPSFLYEFKCQLKKRLPHEITLKV